MRAARDLVSEPANVLTPRAFADACAGLEALGVEVEILDPASLDGWACERILAVGQGSAEPSYVAVMRWRGAASEQPLALIGKGVCFDTGGISIKPGGGMEDMKFDMAGAAAVYGTIHALAARKAAVDVVGVVGLTENMPSGTATRPGDVIRAMSGTTIEVINTDAEGRIVLADVLWLAKERFKPSAMINLATLTGACVVALGHENAGLFANDDDAGVPADRCGRSHGRDAVAAAARARATPGTSSPTSPTSRTSAGHARPALRRRPSSWNASSAMSLGRISTSPAPHGRRGTGPWRPRAPPHSACGCWRGWSRITTRRLDPERALRA